MIAIPQLIVAWLNSDSAIQAAVSGRISTILDPADGLPAIVIGPVSGGPVAMPQASLDLVEKWMVPIYCIAGRRSNGLDDLPDNETAWEVAALVADAMAKLDLERFTTEKAELVSATVASATTSIDPNAGFGRVLVTASVSAWRRS